MTDNRTNVVALPGFEIPTPAGEPVNTVVELLEVLLDEAKAGALVAVQAALLFDHGDGGCTMRHHFAYRKGTGWELVAAGVKAAREFHRHIFDDNDS